jgi:septation ring formation regulator EzrA
MSDPDASIGWRKGASMMPERWQVILNWLPDDLSLDYALRHAMEGDNAREVLNRLIQMKRAEGEAFQEFRRKTEDLKQLSRYLIKQRWENAPPEKQKRVESYEAEVERREGRFHALDLALDDTRHMVRQEERELDDDRREKTT